MALSYSPPANNPASAPPAVVVVVVLVGVVADGVAFLVGEELGAAAVVAVEVPTLPLAVALLLAAAAAAGCCCEELLAELVVGLVTIKTKNSFSLTL